MANNAMPQAPAGSFDLISTGGTSFTIPVKGQKIILPTKNVDALPFHNEFAVNNSRCTIAETPFGGMKGSYSSSFTVGSLCCLTSGCYLQDKNGANTSSYLSSGKLVETSSMTVDTTAKTVTEEFIISNTSTINSASPQYIETGDVAPNGWTTNSGTGLSFSSDNGAIHVSGAMVNGAISTGKTLALNLTGKNFISFRMKASATRRIRFTIKSTSDPINNLVQWANDVRFQATTSFQTFVLPINAPQLSSGSNPTTITGTPNNSDIKQIIIGLYGTGTESVEFWFDDLLADTGKPCYVEIQTNDNLSDSSLQVQAWDATLGTPAYETVGTYKLDSTYAAVGTPTSANWKLLDGTKFDDVYPTAPNGRALFPKSYAGQTVNGSSGSMQYSTNAGTRNRVGLMVTLPPSDNGRTSFNKVKLKTVLSYTDTDGNKVRDISGGMNDLIIVGNPPKLSDGIQFGSPTSGNYLTRTVFPTVNINSNFEIIMKVNLTAVDVLRRLINFITSASNRVALCTGANVVQFAFYTGSAYIKGKTATFGNDLLNTWVTIRAGQLNGSTYLYVNDISGVDGGSGNCAGTAGVFIGGGETNGFNGTFPGKLGYLKISDDTGTLGEYYFNNQNPGNTTYKFSNDNLQSTGLQNLSNPWIGLLDSSGNISYLVFTDRPSEISYIRDDSGSIYEIVIDPGNAMVYRGSTYFGDQTTDTDTDGIPDVLEESVTNSVSNFLQFNAFNS